MRIERRIREGERGKQERVIRRQKMPIRQRFKLIRQGIRLEIKQIALSPFARFPSKLSIASRACRGVAYSMKATPVERPERSYCTGEERVRKGYKEKKVAENEW